jgi:hypothetical protein
VHKHRVAPLGDLVRPRHAAVVPLLMIDHNLQRLRVDPGDLPPAEELVAAMIVQREDPRQRALRSGRLEKHRLAARAAGKLPRQPLYVQAVKFKRFIDAHLALAAQIDRCKALPDARSALGPPLVERLPLPGAKRKPRRPFAKHLLREPRTIRSDHIRPWLLLSEREPH